MSRRWRYPRARRGIVFRTVPQAAPPPGFRDQAGPRPRPAVRRARSGFQFVPSAASTPPAAKPRPRLYLRARRGAFFPVVPAQVVLAPPRVPDRIGRGRTRVTPARRACFPAPPWPQGPAPPPVSSRRQAARPARRGRFLGTPPPHGTPVTRPRRSASLSPPVRRGRIFDTPRPVAAPAPARPPDRVTGRACRLPAIRRHRSAEPPWPQAVTQPPPPSVPGMVRTPRTLVRPRRGCFWQWVIAQAEVPVVTTTRGHVDPLDRAVAGVGHDEHAAPGVRARVRTGGLITDLPRTTGTVRGG